MADYLGLDEIRDEYIYPEEYAGCYINDDNKLVICLTDTNEVILQKYFIICGKNIEFQKVEYSLSVFVNLCEMLEDYNKNENNIRVGYNNKNNKLTIFCDADKKQSVENYIIKNNATYKTFNEINAVSENTFDVKNMISFVTMDNCEAANKDNGILNENILNTENLNSPSVLKPGSRIRNYRDADTGNFTLGIWAKDAFGNIGAITCAHPFFEFHGGFLSSESTVYVGSGTSELGVVQESNAHYNGKSYDCAFISITNFQYLPTTELTIGGSISRLYEKVQAPQGTIVHILGDKTKGVSGKIVDVDVSSGGTIEIGYTIETTNGNIDKGDSGGPAYITENGVNKLLGFQSSGIIKNGVYKYAVISKANLALNIFNATIYTG